MIVCATLMIPTRIFLSFDATGNSSSVDLETLQLPELIRSLVPSLFAYLLLLCLKLMQSL